MDTAALLRTIVEPTRAVILTRLRTGPATVTELAAIADQEASNVSHHLRHLRDLGLVAPRRRGRHMEYRLTDREVERLLDEIDRIAGRLGHVGLLIRLGLPTDHAFHGYG